MSQKRGRSEAGSRWERGRSKEEQGPETRGRIQAGEREARARQEPDRSEVGARKGQGRRKAGEKQERSGGDGLERGGEGGRGASARRVDEARGRSGRGQERPAGARQAQGIGEASARQVQLRRQIRHDSMTPLDAVRRSCRSGAFLALLPTILCCGVKHWVGLHCGMPSTVVRGGSSLERDHLE